MEITNNTVQYDVNDGYNAYGIKLMGESVTLAVDQKMCLFNPMSCRHGFTVAFWFNAVEIDETHTFIDTGVGLNSTGVRILYTGDFAVEVVTTNKKWISEHRQQQVVLLFSNFVIFTP